MLFMKFTSTGCALVLTQDQGIYQEHNKKNKICLETNVWSLLMLAKLQKRNMFLGFLHCESISFFVRKDSVHDLDAGFLRIGFCVFLVDALAR